MEAPADALRALRRARRRNRIAAIDVWDAVYHAYISAIVAIAAVLFISSFVGDGRVTAATADRVASEGPAWLGLIAAVAIAGGLRSGSRGGPLAIEAAEVRHVLLAPVDRGLALRGSALRQLRFAAFVGIVAGAIGGQLAVRRLPGAPVAWVATGAAYGLSVTCLAIGCGFVACGRRLPRPLATLGALAAIGWAVADIGWGIWSPTRLVGSLALWPLEVHPIDIAAPAVIALLVVAGVMGLRGSSIEAAERRTSLVGQLRFAVTVQDLRTVIVLRRQLALDRPRSRPWISLRRRGKHLPTWTRDWRGICRFPAARVLRLVVLAAGAGFVGRGVWNGTSPLVIVGGLALYLAALEAVEPLAQDVDQSDRSDSVPVEQGVLLLRHLPAAAVLMIFAGAIALLTGWLVDPTAKALAVGAIVLAPATLCATAGAVTSVVMGAPAPAGDTSQLLPPEVAGMRIAGRTAWPIIVSVAGFLPLVAGRRAFENGHDPVGPAAITAGFMLVLAIGTALWVRFRVPAKAWWRAMLEESQAASRDRRSALTTKARP